MTILLVAIAMVGIIAMAALSIDVVELYLARMEAQRAADAAAIAGARILSLTGVTGDPDNTLGGLSTPPWPTACTLATQVAQAVANQNNVGGAAAATATVTFLYNGAATDCNIAPGAAFAVNPQVQVQVVRNGLPTLFSRMWGRSTNSVSATATAEAFNPSNSGSFAPSGSVVPVTPRCVKPWIMPNRDLLTGAQFVNPLTGSIITKGIRLGGAGSGEIGENFTLTNACTNPLDCKDRKGQSVAAATYVPALISTSTPASAVPSCADVSDFQKAVGGCDESTVYACGTPGGAQADLTINPYADTYAAVQCLIRDPAGPDVIDVSGFPFQIKAGPANPIAPQNQVLTSSTSIVTIPIFDNGGSWPNADQPAITIVGFLQVFIQGGSETAGGSMNVHVLNVSGCSNNTSNLGVQGTSPVPVRLITPQ